MSHVQSFFVTDFDSIIDDGLVEVSSGPIKADSFYDCIKGIF